MFAIQGNSCDIGRASQVVRSTRLALTTPEQMRFKMAIPTQARALEYFNYDPATGDLIFRERPRSEFDAPGYARHFKLIGTPAGSKNRDGYVKVIVDRALGYTGTDRSVR